MLHNWCNKSIYYPVCWMVHKKDLLLLIIKSSPWSGGNGFLSFSYWSNTICLITYEECVKHCLLPFNLCHKAILICTHITAVPFRLAIFSYVFPQPDSNIMKTSQDVLNQLEQQLEQTRSAMTGEYMARKTAEEKIGSLYSEVDALQREKVTFCY